MAEERVLGPALPLRLRCQVCQHEWDLPWEKGMLVSAFLARRKGNSVCPRCGNKSRARTEAIVMVPRPEVLE